MFHCSSFFETSVGLGHQTNELLTALLSKVNYLRSFFDQNCSFCRSNLRRDASASGDGDGSTIFINFPASPTTMNDRSDGGACLDSKGETAELMAENGTLAGATSRGHYHHHHYHAKSRRSNSFTQAGPILMAFGRRLARSCEDLIAKLMG
uniref:Uncharacterized protein n=1 Tax=Romanomermis culicivorax TaxID=13658 RepID=A0A915IZ41_ROMCU